MRKQSELDAAAARRGIVTGTVTAILRQVGKTVALLIPVPRFTALLADSPGRGRLSNGTNLVVSARGAG
jgi:hypothetical protein